MPGITGVFRNSVLSPTSGLVRDERKNSWLFVILMATGIVAGLSVDFASDAQGSSVLPHLVWLAALAAGISAFQPSSARSANPNPLVPSSF